jgi:hypothetical protein
MAHVSMAISVAAPRNRDVSSHMAIVDRRSLKAEQLSAES